MNIYFDFVWHSKVYTWSHKTYNYIAIYLRKIVITKSIVLLIHFNKIKKNLYIIFNDFFTEFDLIWRHFWCNQMLSTNRNSWSLLKLIWPRGKEPSLKTRCILNSETHCSNEQFCYETLTKQTCCFLSITPPAAIMEILMQQDTVLKPDPKSLKF